MKDKIARKLIEDLADRMGCKIIGEGCLISKGGHDEFVELHRSIFKLRDRIVALETESAVAKEAAKPTCPSCGQKIQEGLQPGNVETVAAAVGKRMRK